MLGAWQAGAFLVVSVSAWYLLKRRHVEFARASLRIGLVVALVASLLQLVTGHESAVGVGKNQPAKLAAFEGHLPDDGPGGALRCSAGWTRKPERFVGVASRAC